jgi:hypothetical protein
VVATSPSGRQVARDQVIVQVLSTDVENQMAVAANLNTENWYVWAYFYNFYSGRAAPEAGSLVQSLLGRTIDNSRLSLSTMPLDTWWTCEVQNNCAAMADFLAPGAPPALPPLTVLQEMQAKSATAQSWDVWNYYFKQITGSVIGGPEDYFPVDPARRFNNMPLDDWWACTQNATCAPAMSDIGA